jgi:hypothetical protein
MSEADWIEDEKTTDGTDTFFAEVFGEKGFDASKSDLLPPGVYRLQVTGAQKKESEKSKTDYLSMTFVILEPEAFAGRRHYENLNFKHPTQKVREIAQRVFKAICRACGVLLPKKFDELIEKECVATIGIRADDQGELRNNVKKWHDASKDVPTVYVEAAGGDGGETFGM